MSKDIHLVAKSTNGKLHVFGRAVSNGLYCYSDLVEQNVETRFDESTLCFLLRLNFPPGSPIAHCISRLNFWNRSELGLGDWIKYWNPSIVKAVLKRESVAKIVHCEHYRVVVTAGQTGSGTGQSMAILSVADSKLITWNSANGLMTNTICAWHLDKSNDSLCLVIEERDHLRCEIFTAFQNSDKHLILSLTEALPKEKRVLANPSEIFQNAILAYIIGSDSSLGRLALLSVQDRFVTVRFPNLFEEKDYFLGWKYGDYLFLQDGNDQPLLLHVLNSESTMREISLSCPELARCSDSHKFSSWLIGEPSASVSSVLAIVQDGHWTLKFPSTAIEKEVSEFALRELPDGIAKATFTLKDLSDQTSLSCFGMTSHLYSLWEQWAVGKKKDALREKSCSELYEEFCNVRIRKMLIDLFGHTIIINRELNRERNFSSIIQDLKIRTPNQVFADKSLLGQILQRLLLLSEHIVLMRLYYEQLAIRYPIERLKEDLNWLANPFGETAAKNAMREESSGFVRRIRDEIRRVQSAVEKIFSEIQMTICPIEDYFLVDGINANSNGVIERYSPIGSSITANQGFDTLASRIALPSLTLNFENFGVSEKTLSLRGSSRESDLIKTSRIKRSAERVGEWWQLLCQNLSIIADETREFVKQEMLGLIGRNSALLDSIPDSDKPKVIQAIEESLKSTIIQESRNGFIEIGRGSGFRAFHLLEMVDQLAKRGSYEYLFSDDSFLFEDFIEFPSETS